MDVSSTTARDRLMIRLQQGPLNHIFRPNKHMDVLEIGVYEGDTGEWLMKNWDCSYTGIDSSERGRDKIVACGGTFLWGRSGVKLRRIEPKTFDLILIDGGHKAFNVLEDSVLAWSIVRPEGVIIWDDYIWNCNTQYQKTFAYDELHNIPKMAIDAFLNCLHGQYRMLFVNQMVAIQKRKTE